MSGWRSELLILYRRKQYPQLVEDAVKLNVCPLLSHTSRAEQRNHVVSMSKKISIYDLCR